MWGSGQSPDNGSRDLSLVGVKGQTAPALGERRDCHYLDFDIKKRASLKEKFKKPSKIKGFGVFLQLSILYTLVNTCLLFGNFSFNCLVILDF